MIFAVFVILAFSIQKIQLSAPSIAVVGEPIHEHTRDLKMFNLAGLPFLFGIAVFSFEGKYFKCIKLKVTPFR